MDEPEPCPRCDLKAAEAELERVRRDAEDVVERVGQLNHAVDEANVRTTRANIKAEQFEKDWMEAKHEFGTQMAKATGAIDEARADADRLRAERDDAQEQIRIAVAIGMKRKGRLDILKATQAKVKALIAERKARCTPPMDEPLIAGGEIVDLLDSPVEPVRVKVGAQGYLFVQGNDGEPIGILYRPKMLGIADQEDILLVPLEEP